MIKQQHISKKTKQVFNIGLSMSMLLGLVAVSTPASQADSGKLRMPTHAVKRIINAPADCTPDILLVMPDAQSDNDEIDQILREANGHVVGSIGEGKLRCLIYQTEKGQMAETEKKLTKDKNHFKNISRNYRYKFSGGGVVNDPNFSSEWHLGAINAPTAWQTTMGGNTQIAILDTGCQASNPDLGSKTQKGYNATTSWAHDTAIGGTGLLGHIFGGLGGDFSSGARNDVQGHGTFVATTAAATANNNQETAGVAPSATIYPVQIADSQGNASDLSIMAGLLNVPESGSKIVNISYASRVSPTQDMTNAQLHAPLHAYFKDFHDNHNGLIFLAAGNLAGFDPNPAVPYLDVVSAIDPTYQLASFSNWGSAVKFTAPGVNIVCSDRNNKVVSENGTSFATPIVASIAALVWNTNPGLSNTAVEAILAASCSKANGANWTPFYGWGLPDAAKAVQLAGSL